jgi:hypothetical protein
MNDDEEPELSQASSAALQSSPARERHASAQPTARRVQRSFRVQDVVSAIIGPVHRLPGNVYQLKIIVPDPASFANLNPNLTNFKFPLKSPWFCRSTAA